MASYPPPPPPFNNDPRVQRRVLREQARIQRLQLRGMRRTSIVGPLLLLSVGVIFLLVQIGRLPMISLFHWFSRWWPLLLVIFGFVRLLEWFLGQRARQPDGRLYPQRSLGAGVGFLLSLLVIAGVASSIAHNKTDRLLGPNFHLDQDNLDQFFGNKHESSQTLSEACPDGSIVTINNPRGNVVISGTSDDNQMHVTINDEVYTRSDSEAASKVREISARLEWNGPQLTLTVPSVESGRAEVIVTLPPNVSLNGTVNRGDIQVHTLRGPVVLTANHGDIDLSAITGKVAAHINNGDSSLSAHSITGDVTVEGRSLDLTLSDITGQVSLNGDFFGTTHLERSIGAVRFHTSRTDMQLARLDGDLEISPNADLSANQVVGPMMLNTRNRNITLDRVSGPLTITNRNGSVTVTAAQPLGPLMIENRNGEVDLTLPTDAQFSLQAETSNADLQNDFGLSLSQDGDRPKLVGSVGRGGVPIQISTSQADISIHKGSVAPIPPVPPVMPRLTSVPPEARQAIRDAQREVRNAMKEAHQAEKQGRLAEKQARDATRQEGGSEDESSH